MLIRSGLLGSVSSLVPMLALASAPPGEGGEGGGSVEQLSGGVTRVTPDGGADDQARREAEAAGGNAPELKEGQPQEPALPEGYDSWEAYGKAVAEGKVTPPAKEEAPAKEEPKPGDVPPELAAKLEPFNAEFAEKGALSDESVAKAAQEFGVSEDMVRQYLAGAQAEAAATTAPFFEQTGGAEGYKQFQEWSVEGMTVDEQQALNEAYAKGGPGALALQEKFVERWKAEGHGKPAADLTREAQQTANQSSDVYESWAQATKDMNKPEYKDDAAFRAKVEAKLGRSNI